ncbi:hypothetical protein [Dyadobacter frigoris]|uniref:Universal stress protein n=1 Tax=Dyadobacter frigoris TaxID=2576211 RepID=A0A4U6D3L6_9BACT|nr:hypothetical protein [Dyadobacter frigoris]TKT90787.1 hypothetical protein FDK13_17620 [Dyadobacter frigoris]GLU52121.1 hypothetical protein Dfri01_15820 [Dyadobacter frigoris]
MKTIIIVSDFSVESFQVAEKIVSNSSEPVRILFTHLFHVPDDIQDLLFSNYRKKEYEFVSDSFRQECEMLKSIFPEILKSIKIEFFYGSKLASFKNFLDYNQADYIAFSESYGIPKLGKSSIDALPVIRKSGITLINTDEILLPAFTGVESVR